MQRRFRDRVAIALESHVAHLAGARCRRSSTTSAPEYLDRLAMLRDQVFALDHMFMSLFSTLGWLFRLAITGILAGVRSIPCWCCCCSARCRRSGCRHGVRRSSVAARNRSIANTRLARHLFVLGTTAPPAKEVRVTNTGDWLITERRAAWKRWYGPVVEGSMGHRRVARAWRGRCSPARMSAPSCTWPPGSTAASAMSCWCWPLGTAWLDTSVRPPASSGSCVVSGSTRRDG